MKREGSFQGEWSVQIASVMAAMSTNVLYKNTVYRIQVYDNTCTSNKTIVELNVH